MEEQVVNFSEKTIKERRKLIFTTMIMMPIIICVFAYIFASSNDSNNLFIMIILMAIIIPLIVIEVAVVTKIMFKKLRETKLIITNTAITRTGGNHQEIINYEDITKINIKYYRNNEIAYIKVNFKHKSINLAGFENMDKVIDLIKEYDIENKIAIKESTYKIDWNNPLVIILIMILTTLVLTAMIKFNINIYELFNRFITIAFGLFFISYKPISRNAGIRFRKFEIIISLIIIIAGVLSFLGSVL